jgi:hypothetical protein
MTDPNQTGSKACPKLLTKIAQKELADSTRQCNFTHGMTREAAMPKCFSPSKVKEHKCEPITASLRGQSNQVYALKKAGLRQYAIADQIGVNKSTISREFKRNTGLRGYRPKQAHRLACSWHAQICRTRISDVMWTRIEKMIREELSPEQITGHLKDIGEPSVSPEWIYQHLYADKRNGGDLHTHLRCQKQRRKRYGSTERRGLRSRIEYPLRNALQSSTCAAALGIGKQIP